MHTTIASLLASYGYLLLFILVGLESVGIPLPGETALVTAAAFAALGHLSISAVIATAVAAAIIGDNGGYWIGRKGGIALVRGYGRPSFPAMSASLATSGICYISARFSGWRARDTVLLGSALGLQREPT